jgi:hypothetical protein
MGFGLRLLWGFMALNSTMALAAPTSDTHTRLYQELLESPVSGRAPAAIFDAYFPFKSDPIGDFRRGRALRAFIASLSLHHLTELSEEALAEVIEKDAGHRFRFDSRSQTFPVEKYLEGNELERWRTLLFQKHVERALSDARPIEPGRFFEGSIFATKKGRAERIFESVFSFSERYPKTYLGLLLGQGAAAYFLDRMNVANHALVMSTSLTAGLGTNLALKQLFRLVLPNTRKALARAEDLVRYAEKFEIPISVGTRRGLQAARLQLINNFKNVTMSLFLPEHFDEIYGLDPYETGAEDLLEHDDRKILLRAGDSIPVWSYAPEKKAYTLKLPPDLLAQVRSEEGLSGRSIDKVLSKELPAGGYWLKMPGLDENTAFYFHPDFSSRPFSTKFSEVEVWEKPYALEARKLLTIPKSADLTVNLAAIQSQIEAAQKVRDACPDSLDRLGGASRSK